MVVALAEVAGDGFDPRGIQRGGGAREEARRVHELAGEDPGGRRLLEGGGGMHDEAKPVRAAVVVRLLVELPDASEETGEERAVERGRGLLVFAPVRFRKGELESFREGFELMGEVAPFAHFRVGEVGGRGEFARLRLRELARFGFPPVPELPYAKEVGAGHAELRVLLVGLLLGVDRSAARVVAREGGHDGDRGGEDGVL